MQTKKGSIHPQNQILAELLNTQGKYCGEEVLKRVLNSDIFILLGEPAIGKSTITEQITNELERSGKTYEVVRYDDVLAEHIAESGSHEEGYELNAKLIQHVLQARIRMAEVGGVVIFDTCAVGKKIPKNRSVSAVEELIRLGRQGNPLFSTFSVLGVVGSGSQQLKHAMIRYDILRRPPEEVIPYIATHNIHVPDIPKDCSERELGLAIKQATRRSAAFTHIAKIGSEVTSQDLDTLRRLGVRQAVQEIQDIRLPQQLSFNGDRTYMQLRAAGMNERARRLELTHSQWLTVINPPQKGEVTWYATQFLRRNSF